MWSRNDGNIADIFILKSSYQVHLKIVSLCGDCESLCMMCIFVLLLKFGDGWNCISNQSEKGMHNYLFRSRSVEQTRDYLHYIWDSVSNDGRGGDEWSHCIICTNWVTFTICFLWIDSSHWAKIKTERSKWMSKQHSFWLDTMTVFSFTDMKVIADRQ